MKATTLAIYLFLPAAACFAQPYSASAKSGCGPAQSQPPSLSDLPRVDDYLQNVVRQGRTPGISVAIVRDGKLLIAKGYGQANVELSVPATKDTVYQLASVTKMFTATAVMMLVEEGKIGLKDKITERLSRLPAAWREVTIHQLLNHTSGIKCYTGVHDFDKMSRRDFTPRELLDLVAKEQLQFTPGEKFGYSNTNYCLLGMLIEQVTGEGYGAFLDRRIFKPLGMTHTRANDLRAIVPNRAQGYTRESKDLKIAEYTSPTQPFAAGMLITSVSDLVKWDAALDSEKLLKRSSLGRMWTPTPLSKGGTAEYGFGWQLSKVNGRRRFFHGGFVSGFSTDLSRFVDDKLTVIVLANSDQCSADSIALDIASRILPALAKKPDEPIPDPDPKTTERLKSVVLAGMKGEADPDLFKEGAKEKLVPEIKRSGKDQLAPFGALKTFRLLERKTTEQGMQLRYRIEFEKKVMEQTFFLDKTGKIERFEGRLLED